MDKLMSFEIEENYFLHEASEVIKFKNFNFKAWINY